MNMTLKEKLSTGITDLVNKVSGVAQAQTDRSNVPKTITPGMTALIRQAAADGAVLLKNDGVLPFEQGTKVSLFSRVAQDWFYVGYGSGGDVNRPYEVSLTEGVRNCDALALNEELAQIYQQWTQEHPVNHGIWGRWPLSHPEMPLTDKTVSRAANVSDVAVVTIGRAAGEDRDCEAEKGSYYLTDEEMHMLFLVTKYFRKTVVLLNIGGVMDMTWTEQFGDRINAILVVWQGGMESGNAVADLLSGKVSPSGRLTDTVVREYVNDPSSDFFGDKDCNEYYEDIFVGYRYFETFAPEHVLYPFGFGLSYTEFDVAVVRSEAEQDGFTVTVRVKNIGKRSGKEVVQLYLQKPNGKLGNPLRELVAFAKTKVLAPDETQELTLTVTVAQLTSYDDCGATGHPFADVIEAGEYQLFLGKNVRDVQPVLSYYQQTDAVYAQHRQAAAPQKPFEIICAREENGKRVMKIKNTQPQKYDLGARIINHLPEDIPYTGDKGIQLADVKEGRATMESFVAQLSLDELEAITRGDYKMDSKLGADGNAGAMGGVLPSLRDKGVPPLITTDGPSGIRLKASCSLIPIGTLLACAFDTDLVEALYTAVAQEMKEKGSDILLAPGINIHRNPLCGRNFEYYSEDPYLTGKMAAAAVRGIQSEGASACPKHFACNNQEYRRTVCDSRLSERALRQIYLKGFEICVKEAAPKNLMTSYNKINGVWGHYHYDLCTTILRGEWHYRGNVMTDWWMKPSKSPEFPELCDQAYRVRAQVDVLMPGAKRVNNGKPDGTLLQSYGKPLGIRLGEMQRSAINVLNAAIQIKG